jgi:osmotically inducible protein OsmC
MPVRKAEAEWKGTLKEGSGSVNLGGGIELPYSFTSRFESGSGTNPESLLGAAHAGCFSMALNAALFKAGHSPKRIKTVASVSLDKVGEGFGITSIALDCEAEVPGLDDATFQQHANSTKDNCIVSKALKSVPMTLNARLL